MQASFPASNQTVNQPVHCPPLKSGVTYAMIKPKPLRIAQVIQIRLSQARLSSTVRPEREKFMSSKATEAVTMAAIVEMARIWVYTSCMISLALVHTSVAA